VAATRRVRRRSDPLAGAAPLPPRTKWRAITLATLAWVPGYWFLLAGIVSAATTSKARIAPSAGPSIAFGLCLIPFVFIVLAFLSEHPRAPMAVVKAMGLTLLVGIPVSAFTADAVTGMVAGMGAGGVAALRRDSAHNWKDRALAVAIASVFVFLLVRVTGEVALLLAPVLPFTVLGVADHLLEERRDRRSRSG
jgi:hypothetical protein